MLALFFSSGVGAYDEIENEIAERSLKQPEEQLPDLDGALAKRISNKKDILAMIPTFRWTIVCVFL